MFRLLVVEDQIEFYRDYMLRIFEKSLPMKAISITHSPTLNAALEALREPWDMILMDYSMGPRIQFIGDPVQDGADLTRFRRAIEQDSKLGKSFILGIHSNQVGNLRMQERGTNSTVQKIQVLEMVKLIRGELKKT